MTLKFILDIASLCSDSDHEVDTILKSFRSVFAFYDSLILATETEKSCFLFHIQF